MTSPMTSQTTPHPGLPLQLQDEEQRRKDSERRHDGHQWEPEGPGGIWARVAEEDETGTFTRAATLCETSSSRNRCGKRALQHRPRLVPLFCSSVTSWSRWDLVRSWSLR